MALPTLIQPLQSVLPLHQTQHLTGLGGGSKSLLIAQLSKRCKQLIILTTTDAEADALLGDVEAWLPFVYPEHAPTLLLFPEVDAALRLSTLSRMQKEKTFILFTHLEAIHRPTLSKQQLTHTQLELRPGKNYPRVAFLESLAQGGYARVEMVQMEGEAAIRGEVVDVWAAGAPGPWRLLFDFDKLESIREFHPGTQRSEQYIGPQLLLPMKETVQEGALHDYLDDSMVWFADEVVSPFSWPGLWYRSLPDPDSIDLQALSMKGRGTSIASASQQALKAKQNKQTVFFFSSNAGESERLAELLDEQIGTSQTEGFQHVIGPLREGFEAPGISVFTNAEIFGRTRYRPRLTKFKGGQAVREIQDLQPGHYVVHAHYGVGRYRGLELIKAGGQEADYLKVEYRGGDRLYVPLTDFKQVQKYSGSEGNAPRLNSLDTAAWERVKDRVKENVEALAQDLIQIHAARAARPGHAFPNDNHLEEEFAASFPYEETQDQLRAIAEVKKDMQSSRPMDRLVFGDVGYGKTEVAMRAAFKAVMDSKQVAVLVPTTILAEQHYRNFTERFADYPAKIGMLSRFQSKEATKATIAGIADGTLDIVIGTHRLFQKDITFRDLGLLIIDEEHRFGVKHKERMKKMREKLDVLTMTATPIPRTLTMALSGLRELSIIETPPVGRLPISTYVGPLEDSKVIQAIEQELERKGQVFYVHNRVQSLESRMRYLQKLRPDLSIAMVHGQMSGPAIERTMWEFVHRKHQVLLATTIIESGIDIPTVNTLIVEEAEEFGLAQLYQLRGRVGRDRQKAYCYLFYSPTIPLTQEARARLEALREFTQLGSGYHLAVRDMEIRGTGNLLGQQQHGFIAAVGLDMYSQLLQEEISKLKGEPIEEQVQFPTLNLLVRSHFSSDYLPSEDLRIQFYKRLVSAPKEEDLAALRTELEDRFGPLPEEAETLFEVSSLRLKAHAIGIEGVLQKSATLEVSFRENTIVEPTHLLELAQSWSHVRFRPGPPFTLIIQSQAYESKGVLKYLSGLFEQLTAN